MLSVIGHFVCVLTEQEITLEDLLNLFVITDDTLAKLIPKFGPRIRLQHRLTEVLLC